MYCTQLQMDDTFTLAIRNGMLQKKKLDFYQLAGEFYARDIDPDKGFFWFFAIFRVDSEIGENESYPVPVYFVSCVVSLVTQVAHEMATACKYVLVKRL